MKKTLTLLLGFGCFYAAASENFSDHEVYCAQQSQVSCLDFIDQQLASAQLYSDKWYEIKSYQFDYYYDKLAYQTLKDSTEPFTKTTLSSIKNMQSSFFVAKHML